MKRLLWLLPLAVFVYGAGFLLEPTFGRDTVFRVQLALVGFLAAIAGVRAARRFAHDDLLRPGSSSASTTQ